MKQRNLTIFMKKFFLMTIMCLFLLAGMGCVPGAPLPGLATPEQATPTSGPAPSQGTMELTQGWAINSVDKVSADGAALSQAGYEVPGWYPVTLPSTVMAGLVANGVYKDINNDTNLKSVPDLTTRKWWYRGEFTAPAAGSGQQYWLRFKGIAYRAQIWLNGTQLDPDAVGTLVNHEYNVTGLIHPGALNALALLVTPPTQEGKDLSFWYVDWNPKPPDMNAGIWGKVLLDTSGPVVLRDSYVKTILSLPETDSAYLTVYVDAANGSAGPVQGVLSGQISKPGYPTVTFSREVRLNARERREFSFDPDTFKQLRIDKPALWWPIHMGSPELYDLQLSFTVDGQLSYSASTRFGIRRISDYVTTSIYGNTYRGYQVNGQNVLIRGADYVWDMLLRTPSNVNRAHMLYVKDMGLNLIRFEGILGNEEIYDLADQYGILLMPGYVCCTYWAEYDSWTKEDAGIAAASLDSQMRLLRSHPSAMVWAYGSDELPPANVLAAFKSVASKLHWQNPTLDNLAAYNHSESSVPKMNGPYVWEPPVYWYTDTKNGGAFGFTAEHGGESVPPEESLRKFISAPNLWPIGDVYGYHAGADPFDNLNFYTPGIDKRYGTPRNISEYADRAQLLNYESERAQFEAFGANAHTLAQGTVYWMLNNAWPSVHWNLYDYYFKPGGGYFGTKKALEPVHILYDYATRDVKVFNATLADAPNLTASVKIYNIPDLALKYSNEVSMDFPANASTLAFNIPAVSGLTKTYFIRLQLRDSSNQPVSDNLYWYSTSPDTLGEASDWYYTSVGSYADLSGLNSLKPNTGVTASATRTSSGGTETVTLTLNNPSATNVAFFLRPEVTAGSDGLEVLPVTYSDNYITLFPGESLTITAQYATADLGGQSPFLRVRGYNVPVFNIPIP